MKQKLKILRSTPLILFLVLWYFLAWSWVFITDSMDLAGSKSVALAIGLWVVVFNVGLSVLVVTKVFNLLHQNIQSLSNRLVVVLGLPLFALMDFLVSWITAIIWIGPQGSVDNVLPLSSPTVFLINTPFAFASRIVGFYGLAGFFWLTIFLMQNNHRRKYALVSISLLSTLSLLGYVVYRTPNGSPVQATIISEELDQHIEPIKDSSSNLVVFPEYALDDINSQNLSKRISSTQKTDAVYFVGSAQVNDYRPTGHLNVLRFGNSKEGITSSQDKSRLIPGGEDLAYTIRVMLRATNQKNTLDYFSYAKMVNKGSAPLTPLKIDHSTVLGSAVCSSIIAPKDYQIFALKGATLFTNSASLTIFKGSRVFSWQQQSLARFMAIANSRYFLQSANASKAYALDNNGRQIAEIRGITATEVVAVNNQTKTLFTYIGEALVAIGCLIVGIWLVRHLIAGNKITHKSHKNSKSKVL